MEMANLYGIMDKNSKGNGKMVKKMDLELGNLQRETITRANGKKTDSMAKATTFISRAPSIEAISKTF
jgi:hypothetical protein